MKIDRYNFARETRFAKSLYGDLSKSVLLALSGLIQGHQIFVTNGDVKYLDGGWYVTHSGLLRLADRRRRGVIHDPDTTCGASAKAADRRCDLRAVAGCG